MILVTGATGAIGPSVVQALQEAGYHVRALSRDPSQIVLPDDVEVRPGDITDLGAVQAAMQGVEAVIHLAALLHIVTSLLALREQYEHVNVGGTANIVQAALQVGVKRVVLFSTIAVYGHAAGQVLNEDSPTHPDTFYGQTKLAAEHVLAGAKGADGQALGTVLRLGAVYGARVQGNYARLVEALARGRFVPVGDGRNRRTLVYDRDVARAAVLAVQHPGAAGRIYNVTDGQFHTLSEIIAAISEALGCRPPSWSVPVRPARLAVGLLGDITRLAGRQLSINRETIDKYTEDVAVEGQRIQTELGFKPQFGLHAGWHDTIREMRQQAKLC